MAPAGAAAPVDLVKAWVVDHRRQIDSVKRRLDAASGAYYTELYSGFLDELTHDILVIKRREITERADAREAAMLLAFWDSTFRSHRKK